VTDPGCTASAYSRFFIGDSLKHIKIPANAVNYCFTTVFGCGIIYKYVIVQEYRPRLSPVDFHHPGTQTVGTHF